MHDSRLFTKVYCVQMQSVIELIYHSIEDSLLDLFNQAIRLPNQ